MSMIGNLVAVSPEQLQSFMADPGLIVPFLSPDEGGAEPANHLDLDKAWHAIHFTLNGKEWEGEEPFFLAILGGEPIGEDVGCGPVRYLTPAQVAMLSEALSGITAENFGEKFDHSALAAAEVYPNIWQAEGAESLEYVQPYYADLRSFYQAAAGRNEAVLIYFN